MKKKVVKNKKELPRISPIPELVEEYIPPRVQPFKSVIVGSETLKSDLKIKELKMFFIMILIFLVVLFCVLFISFLFNNQDIISKFKHFFSSNMLIFNVIAIILIFIIIEIIILLVRSQLHYINI